MESNLRPAGYQLVALTKLLLNRLNCVLIADGVGVGKTISAGYILDRFSARGQGPCLVVCPPGLVDKWRFELKSKFRKNPRTIRSDEEFQTTRLELQHGARREIYISPYSMLGELASAANFPVVVIDEIHNFRNQETKRWGDVYGVAQRAEWRVGLSATPVNNSIGDLGNELSILLPQFHPATVAATIEDIWQGGQFSLLNPVITRFTKEELRIHFASRRIKDIHVQFPSKYAARVREIIAAIKGRTPQRDSYPIDSITFFREAASSPAAFASSVGEKVPLDHDPKLGALLDILGQHKAQVLVFCQFLPTVKYIASSVADREVFVLTGDVPVSDREAVIDSFQLSPSGVLLLTAVGSEGLDLQFCNVVINYDLHWNPMVLEQRIGRCDRVGQQKTSLDIYNLHVTGSIDDRVLRIVGKKLLLLAGTPLDQKKILSQTGDLYDSESEEQERLRADEVVTALTYATSLRTADSVILPHVAASYARVGAVVESSPTDWISRLPETEAWLNTLQREGSAFLANLSRLQSYVT